MAETSKIAAEIREQRETQRATLKSILRKVFKNYYDAYHELPDFKETPDKEKAVEIFLLNRVETWRQIQQLDLARPAVTEIALEVLEEMKKKIGGKPNKS